MIHCINLLKLDSRYVHLSHLHGQISTGDAATRVTSSDVCAGDFSNRECLCMWSCVHSFSPITGDRFVVSVSFSALRHVRYIM
ncbi:uncharacterized [Tachysurus ichikawai]